MAISSWMKSFPEGFRGVTCSPEETFYKLRAKVNKGLANLITKAARQGPKVHAKNRD